MGEGESTQKMINGARERKREIWSSLQKRGLQVRIILLLCMIAFNLSGSFGLYVLSLSSSFSLSIYYCCYSVRPRGCAILQGREERREKEKRGWGEMSEAIFIQMKKVRKRGCCVWGAGPWQAFYT